MQDKKTVYTSKNIVQALGVFLILCCAVLFLAPAGNLWPLGYGVYFLFGQVGYYLVLPFLVLLGALLAFRGSLKKCFLSWNVYLGVFILFLGLLTLLSHIGFAGKEDADYATFAKVIDGYQGTNASALFLSDKIGGGISGFYLSSFALKGGAALLWTLAIVFIVLGVLIALFPLWKALFLFLRRRIKTASAKHQAEKETARLKAEAEEAARREISAQPLDDVPAVEGTLPSPSATPEKEAPAPEIAEEEIPTLSRSDVYGEKPTSPLPSAIAPTPGQLNHPFVSPNEMAHSGLQEAVFVADEDEAKHLEETQKAPVLSSTVVNPPEEGIHSNEIPTPSETPEETPSAAPAESAPVIHSNEIPTPVKTEKAPTPVVTPVSQPTPTPSPSFAVKPAPEKVAPQPAAPVEEKPEPSLENNEIPTILSPATEKPAPAKPTPIAVDMVDVEEEPTPTAPAKPAPTLASATPSPTIVSVPMKSPANPTPIVPEEPAKAPEKPTPIVSIPPVTPAPAPEAPVSPLDQCNQPKATNLPPYRFPSLDLLRTYPANANQAQMELECQARAATINQAFTDLGAGAQVVSYTIGPSVTRFDIQTDKDVSVSSLSRYVQDISVRLNGVATRFEEVVRGKSTSGLEIANSSTTTVSLKEMVSALPKGDKYNLYIPFGKSISGDYISADLSEFPHLLVSGSTGSGKSIFMHGLIMSLIMRNRPEDLKLVVVDPKRVEMGKYKDLPHLLCPIIKEPSQAKVCFQKLIDEMERRYTLFELSGVSNIRQFNSEYAPEAGFAKLPFIVVVVDEYADLVDTCKDIGDGVVRLAQKARAAGIHLVIATQRPSVQVITGVIKANLPVRVALSVSSATDSMTILGQGGAEDLAGHGDMLVDCSLVARNGFTRCQGCFVDNKEIKAVVDDIKSQENVVYDPNFLDLVDHDAEAKAAAAAAPAIDKAELKAKGDDDLYETIKVDIMNQEYTSISRIQRSYGVGFPRAGKIFARLQAEGVVAQQPDTASSSKGCRVLKHDNPAPSTNAGSSDQTSVALTPNSPYPSTNGGNNG
jgi:DNA segregation ATPase FtsK/SpoIIIE-like protein